MIFVVHAKLLKTNNTTKYTRNKIRTEKILHNYYEILK